LGFERFPDQEIFLLTLVFNFLMAIVDVTALGFVRGRVGLASCFAALLVAGVLAAALSITTTAIIGGTPFDCMRLAAWGIFVHGPLLLLGCAVLIWRRSRLLSLAGAALAVLLTAVAVEAFLIEPTQLEVTRVPLVSDKITKPVRIVVVADLQTDVIGPYERRALKRAMDEKPDLLLFAGDYIQVNDRQERERLHGELRQYLQEIELQAPLGVFAVRGNTDGDWQRIFDGLPATTFDETRSVETGELQVTGLWVYDSFDTDARVAACDRFHIVLGHSPNFALGDVQADLLVAGHTHGGQVRLPWIGPLITLSEVRRSWAAGVTELDEDRTLIVSRGVGRERLGAPQLRFLCRPELVVVELEPK